MKQLGTMTHAISTYAEDLRAERLLSHLVAADDSDLARIEIRALSFDSRDISPGTLFICKGRAFNKIYLERAVEAGAVAYVSETAYEDMAIPGLIVHDVRLSMATLSRRMYNNPQNELTLIGITGTKGKSTTTRMMQQIMNCWQEKLGLPPVGVISSITYFDGVKETEAVLTTPEIPDLYRMLRTGVEAGLNYFIIEVSSQALKYDRLDGVRFATAAFLNISEDHISPVEHPDFTDYLESKLRIFEHSDRLVFSLDTGESAKLKIAARGMEYLTFSVRDNSADLHCAEIQTDEDGLNLLVRQTNGADLSLRVNMAGRFNAENALAAVALSDQLGVPTECVQQGLADARADGRMEIIRSADEPIAVIVDFAHNTLSWDYLASTAAELFPDRDLIYVGGVAGGKALNRRKDLGRFLGSGKIKKAYLTASNPGLERTEDICEEIISHIRPTSIPTEIIVDRDEAIGKAIADIENPAVVLLAGQGAHTNMWIGRDLVKRKSDREVATAALKRRRRK
ncbi:MAG: Mur ligase family protein [Fastidiosipilaceae bacterium]|jgi:UDP-N-acetylmuramyl-tripeptide synthetase